MDVNGHSILMVDTVTYKSAETCAAEPNPPRASDAMRCSFIIGTQTTAAQRVICVIRYQSVTPILLRHVYPLIVTTMLFLRTILGYS